MSVNTAAIMRNTLSPSVCLVIQKYVGFSLVANKK